MLGFADYGHFSTYKDLEKAPRAACTIVFHVAE
jgi:hypothetical protein